MHLLAPDLDPEKMLLGHLDVDPIRRTIIGDYEQIFLPKVLVR
jgi:hypothetical protein